MSSTSIPLAFASAVNSRPPLFLAQPLLNEESSPIISRVLIANRGEIACRVIATCRKLNITSIAVYVQEDQESRHVSDADEAIDLGSIETATVNPFLDIELLVSKALEAGAHAIHPGYGYLSENPDFADSVRNAGLIFLGPSSTAMSTLGNKRASKEYLIKNAPDVPLIPGFSGTSQNLKDLEDAATSIGFPVMLKASAGGGGKGMRIVREQSALHSELERAQSEAKRSFGSGDCILEKYIEAGKHVEVQIIGDQHGRVVSLWDRDCSVQRRHQKVIEEAPCPWLSDKLRKQMCASAVHIAELIAYEGAGTVEFVVDIKAEKYYFLEVNARLQVEHPITEEITGFDLVSLQLYVATGGRLAELEPLKDVAKNGHAIECRLCAEDAHRDFFPEHGIIRVWQPAPGVFGPGRDVRYETAVQTGSRISIYFDSMIGKLIVWAPNRDLAIGKMIKVLANTACVGIRTNQLFLQSCLTHPDFRDPAYTTSFIPTNIERLLQNPHRADSRSLTELLGSVASSYMRIMRRRSRSTFRNTSLGFRNQKFDPINRHTDIVVILSEGVSNDSALKESTMNVAEVVSDSLRQFRVHSNKLPPISGDTRDGISPTNILTAKYNSLSAVIRSGAWRASQPQEVMIHDITTLSLDSKWRTEVVTSSIDKKRLTAIFTTDSSQIRSSPPDSGCGTIVYAHIPAMGTWVEYRIYTMLAFAESMRESIVETAQPGAKVVKAPMPCKILRVLKGEGDKVEDGEIVMVVESMKMEMSITASSQGEFRTERHEEEAVDEGTVLCVIS